MRFTVLSSGSKGNALLVESGETTVMVEAGLMPKTLSERMRQAHVDAGRIKALFITHNHYDHARSAAAVAESLNIPTLATNLCAQAQVKAGAPFFAHQAINVKEPVTIGSLTVRCFATPHDAPGSVGLVFEDGDARMAVVTDLGHVHAWLVESVRDVNLLYVEFNHDVDMLLNGPYPAFLKNRVRSNHGHLSNEQGADLVGRSKGSELKQVVLAHLSEVNNTPALAMKAARSVLDGSGVDIQIAPQHEALGPIDVKRGTNPPVRRPAGTPVRFPTVPIRSALPIPPSGPGPGPAAQLSLFASPSAKP